MSSLRERLLRHKKTESSGAVDKPPEEPAMDAREETSSGEKNEWDCIEGSMLDTEWGSFVIRRRAYPYSYQHGTYTLGELAEGAEQLRLLLPAEHPLRGDGETGIGLERLLFMDTETTGLGLGAGNVPFMIGIGYYERECFHVEQMLIRHPGEELAMLSYLQQKLAAHPYLVSYNGKTFDWPIVKNRYVMNRLKNVVEPQEHLDFLYPSRSLWRNTLPSCRLGKVEEARLGVIREDDVSGSLAPALYFRYLAERDPSVLKGVFIHNELDLLSLAGLAVHFVKLLQGKIPLQQILHFGLEELFRLGLWLDKTGLADRADMTLDRLCTELLDPKRSMEAIEEEAEDAEDSDCLLPLAQFYKQRGRYILACRLWERYLERKGSKPTCSLEPYIELSMFYEHKEKHYAHALYYAEEALNKVWQRSALKRSSRGKAGKAGSRRAASEVKDETAELEKRVERLKRKLAAPAARAGNSARSGQRKTREPDSVYRRKASSDDQLAFPMD